MAPIHLVLLLSISWFAPAPVAMAAKLTPEERQWLNMVDFIITPEERRVFRKRLTTSSERQRFIELFWAKRDPDLTDSVNPFRDNFLARFDYVTTHFEAGKKRIPKDQRSFIYLLLGEPDRKELRVETTFLGPRYRNPYPHHPPELWTYEDPGYDYQRSRLRIQFLPTSPFGDYTAYLDAYSGNWLRNLENVFIVNPDLERAPLVDVTGTTARGVISPAVSATAPDPSVLPSDESAETVLPVPTAVNPSERDALPVSMQPDSGNALGIKIRTGYFRSGRDGTLLLARTGFPLSSLDFDFADNQYQSSFKMSYRFQTAEGRILTADKFQNDLSVPNQSAIEDSLYTRELAVLLDPGVYSLHVQVEDLRTGNIAYHQSPIDIPILGGDDGSGNSPFTITPLVLMDPNVSENAAKFSVQGRPMGLHLTSRVSKGERLYPILEILGVPDIETLETAQIHAVRENVIKHTWVLFPDEEITSSAHGTMIVHPTLRTSTLDPGTYTLRFEIERPSGELVLSQTEVMIE